jgi:flagellar L-ring protein precursor FlgH
MSVSRTSQAALCLSGALILLAGCNATHEKPAAMPPIMPSQTYVEPETKYANPGSIYTEGDGDGLFADTRARRVGDIIMVSIVDTMKARNRADLTANKDLTNQYEVNAFAKFGDITGFTGQNYKASAGPGLVFDTSSSSQNTSKGETNRENLVTATVAARVVRLLPGDAMQIEGARETKVNDETQYLVVRGIIRA